ncbi:hypothetical protein ASPSYDRAFT_139569 [Aspergillus sydowii CBS 593.65]|uniref:Asparaginase n=1 Tax=Aspergillus sydowii CBS 593.65 TaxID=1036612 RepID=A0A1L9TY35_9EURO|nr:uncharacterized protein ASPSYDRAFT_139569 [Aspergillus sydowii CBS 593.65]OJJ64305.1 hypothetical protein ASPSYDRAFT_139569 [Aspergillus sydowii CBS 593.65]
MTSTPIFKPALILHGGAGAIHRSTLPPDLYAKYRASLLSYLRSTKKLLDDGARAVDAAVHAVSLMEDDEIFNCGRGSVFTSAGTIEMEASLMVTSARSDNNVTNKSDTMKRGAGVICVRNVRHPIQLAKEVLVRAGQDENGNLVPGDGGHDNGSMHSQLSGPYVEELARSWGLEFKPDEWFWTQKRWDEHQRGLHKPNRECTSGSGLGLGYGYPSQGTVGCVCLDQWGDLAVATSTGGLTNKLPGRVGDTPTLGAGFWAEAWDVEGRDSTSQLEDMRYLPQSGQPPFRNVGSSRSVWDMAFADCVPDLSSLFRETFGAEPDTNINTRSLPKRRAAAVSGTGNGDAFLRTAAARTTCAMMRFSEQTVSLGKAISAVAGAGGELQRSAGRRWGKTSEGQGGIIGIEAEIDEDTIAESGLRRGKVVSDFNCGGLFRAWVEEDVDGRDIEHVMVFKEPYR